MTSTPMSRSLRTALTTRRQASRGAPSQMSGFVTEAFSWRHREVMSHDRDSDEETTLEDVEYPARHMNDPVTVGRKLYQQTCDQLHVVPISLVLRSIAQEQLSLCNRNCGPQGAKALAAPLLINTSIVELDLSENDIQDTGLVHILSMLEENKIIKKINLAQNNLSSKCVPLLCRHFCKNSTLVHLDLSGNPFRDSSGHLFEKLLQNNKSLKTLTLSNNDLGIETAIDIGNAITSNETLNCLDLSWNHIRLRGAHAIAKGLKENITIHSMNLGWNGFGMEDAMCLSSVLQDNTSLMELDLSGNRLNDAAVVLLAAGLKKNEGLQVLKLSGNPFTHVGAFGVLKAFSESETSTLNTLEMKDITVREDFTDLLHQLTAIDKRKLHATYRAFPVRKNSSNQHTSNRMKTYLQRAVKFMVKIEKPLQELFPTVTEDSEDTCAIKEEFIDKLQSVGITLSSSHLEALATHLENEDRGLLDLSPMFQLEKELLLQEDERVRPIEEDAEVVDDNNHANGSNDKDNDNDDDNDNDNVSAVNEGEKLDNDIDLNGGNPTTTTQSRETPPRTTTPGATTPDTTPPGATPPVTTTPDTTPPGATPTESPPDFVKGETYSVDKSKENSSDVTMT